MFEFRPANPERPLRDGQRGRKCVEIVAIDPPSVVCEESIFVNAVTTLGIPLIDFAEIREEIAGRIRRTFVWRLEVRSLDGVTTLQELRKWWQDPAWLAANSTHELAVAKITSENLLRFAARVRQQPWLLRVSSRTGTGRTAVFIPSNATPEERAALLASLES